MHAFPTCSKWRNILRSLPVYTPDVRSEDAAISFRREHQELEDICRQTRSDHGHSQRKKMINIYRKRFRNFFCARLAESFLSNWLLYRFDSLVLPTVAAISFRRTCVGCNGGKSTCSGGNKGAVCDKQITSIKITLFWLCLINTILFFF